MMKRILCLLILALSASSAFGQDARQKVTVTEYRTSTTVPPYCQTGRACVYSDGGTLKSVYNGTVTTLSGGGSGTVTSVSFTGGLISVATATTTPALTVAGTSGGVPYFSSASTWASSGALTSNALVLGGGAGAAPKVAAGLTTDGTSVLTLGVAGTSVGAVAFKNATSGTITLQPVTGALGTVTLSLPATTGTLALTSALPAGANPTASVGLSTVNGVATTFLRSDGAPALDQSIAPTWTGIHTFTNEVTTGTTSTSGTVHNYNSLTTGTGMYIGSTSTAGSSTKSVLFDVSRSGAQSGTVTTTAARIANTATGESATNVALTLTASGATSANTALNVTAGQSLFASGTSALPGMAWGSQTGTGWYLAGGNTTGYEASGVGQWAVDNSGLVMRTAYTLGWSASTPLVAADLILRRSAAANLAFGAADAASPIAQTLSVQNVVAGTSNTAGVDWTRKASAGTGTGAGGKHIWQVAPAGSTGSTQNSFVTAMTLDSAKVLTLAGDLQGTTATFSGAITVASCTGCGSGTTYASSGNYWPFPQEQFGTAANSSALVASANQVRAVKVFLNRAITVDRLGIKGAGGSAGLASFAIYNADGSSRLVYSGTIDSNTGWTSAQAVTVSNSGTVGPGYIMVAWTADNTSATIYTHAYNSNWLQLQTVGTSAIVGTCANAATSGALPSTCGAFTADSSITNFPMLNWFKN